MQIYKSSEYQRSKKQEARSTVDLVLIGVLISGEASHVAIYFGTLGVALGGKSSKEVNIYLRMCSQVDVQIYRPE